MSIGDKRILQSKAPFRSTALPHSSVHVDQAQSKHPDRPHNHDVHEKSHIRMDLIRTRVELLPIDPTPGGQTIGERIDADTRTAVERGDRIASVSFVITEDDWEKIVNRIRPRPITHCMSCGNPIEKCNCGVSGD